MGNPEIPRETTYVLEWNPAVCPCNDHKKEVEDCLNKIGGVKISGEIDIANGQGKVTINISGPIKPHKVKRKFQMADDKIKKVELILLKESPPPPPLDNQETQIVSRQQRQGISNNALDESTSWKITKALFGFVLKFTFWILQILQQKLFSHKHKLKLTRLNNLFTCEECKEDGFGSRYRCEHKDFAYEVHEECMNPKHTKTLTLFNDQSITFEFQHSPPRKDKQCDACGKKIRGCFYKATNSEWALNLHPWCSSLRNLLRVKNSVNQNITFHIYKEVSQGTRSCFLCKKDKSRGWSYVSDCNKCRFHLCCVIEMLHEVWKGSDTADDIDGAITKALKTKLSAMSGKNGGGKRAREMVWIIAKIFFKTIISILLGDPTGLVVGQLMN